MNTQILYEDKQLLVCYKPAGLAVQSGQIGRMDMESELKNYLVKEAGGIPFLGIVHRLDQPVEGLLVFAKTRQAAAELNRQLAQGVLQKRYYAAVCGKLPVQSTVLVDYLMKDSRSGAARITGRETAGAKRAELKYTEIAYCGKEDISLAGVALATGRFHQIRAQMAHAGFPLLGDIKYGTRESCRRSEEAGVKTVALCAYFLEFVHPATGKKLSFERMPDNAVFLNFQQILEKANCGK